jgi:nucleoside-diphosphate-sugar epimerase
MIFPDCNMGFAEHDVRVLVFGGTGLTGPFVVRRLCGLGYEAAVFHRGEHEAELPADVIHIHAVWPIRP